MRNPMAKPTKETLHVDGKFYKLTKVGDYYAITTLTVVNDKITNVEQTNENFLQIAMGEIQRLVMKPHFSGFTQ